MKNNLVTFEQAKVLKELGFDNTNSYHFKGVVDGILINEKLPSISESLQWIREEKNIPCAVMIEFEADRLQFFYYGEYAKIRTEGLIENTNSFDTYQEAESALLNELLTYLTKQL